MSIELSERELAQYNLVTQIANEVVGLVRSREDEFDDPWCESVLIAVIAPIISNVVHRCLVGAPGRSVAGLSTDEHYKQTKELVEIAVGAGFSAAFSRILHVEDVDFFVRVKPVPEPTQSVPC